MKAPKVALLGFELESYRFSRLAELKGLKNLVSLEGDALLEEARKPIPYLATEFSSFVMETV